MQGDQLFSGLSQIVPVAVANGVAGELFIQAINGHGFFSFRSDIVGLFDPDGQNDPLGVRRQVDRDGCDGRLAGQDDGEPGVPEAPCGGDGLGRVHEILGVQSDVEIMAGCHALGLFPQALVENLGFIKCPLRYRRVKSHGLVRDMGLVAQGQAFVQTVLLDEHSVVLGRVVPGYGKKSGKGRQCARIGQNLTGETVAVQGDGGELAIVMVVDVVGADGLAAEKNELLKRAGVVLSDEVFDCPQNGHKICCVVKDAYRVLHGGGELLSF